MVDPIRVGLLGAGWITRAHGHALHTLGHVAPLDRPIRLTALAARNPERGAAMARDLEVERFTPRRRAGERRAIADLRPTGSGA